MHIDAIFPAACAVALLLAGPPPPSAGKRSGPLAATIEIHAREVAPGEPVRIRVLVDGAIAEARASFLGREIALAPEPCGPIDGAWSGWGLVDLDDPAGTAAVEVRGRTARGREIVGTRAVTVRPRTFPEERLAVAPRYVEPPDDQREAIAEQRRILARIWAARTPPERICEPFARPVSGAATSIFGTRRVFNGQARDPHPGLDLRAATGTPVRSAGAGRVALARSLYYAGGTVIVDHGGGLTTIFAHLSRIDVSEGERIERGRVVGLSGETGRVTGPHLHWGAKVGDRPFDPRALLDRRLFER